MDWVTLTIEAVGVIILIAWVVIPLQEFKHILRRVRQRNEANGRKDRPA